MNDKTNIQFVKQIEHINKLAEDVAVNKKHKPVDYCQQKIGKNK
jgi:hypothetical protein